MSKEQDGDRPRFLNSRRSAVLWFIKKHAFHLTVKVAFVVILIMAGADVYRKVFFGGSLFSQPQPIENIRDDSNNFAKVAPELINDVKFEPQESDKVKAKDQSKPLSSPKITAFLQDGVYAGGKRYGIGDYYPTESGHKRIKAINVKYKSVLFDDLSVYPRTWEYSGSCVCPDCVAESERLSELSEAGTADEIELPEDGNSNDGVSAESDESLYDRLRGGELGRSDGDIESGNGDNDHDERVGVSSDGQR